MDANAQVGEAIVAHLGSHWSNETTQGIEAQFGADVAARAKVVYDDAMNCPVDWQTATMDDALDALHLFLHEKYSWLTPGARSRLNYSYIMAWK